MKIRFTKQVGGINFEIEEEASTQADIFDVVEFWSSLPDAGPGGETDLRFAHRVAQGYDFYEIVSPSAGQRFCFGQRKEGKGILFPKGWEPVYHGNDEQQYSERESQPQSRPQAAERRQSSQGGGDKEQRLNAEIKDLFSSLGIQNVGQEKVTIMKALNLKVGMVLQELAFNEKLDLYEYLVEQAKSGQRRAAA